MSAYFLNPNESARRVKEIRDLHGMTQKAIGEMAEVAAATVCRIENGYINEMAYKIIIAICQALDISVGYILCWTDEMRTFSGGRFRY